MKKMTTIEAIGAIFTLMALFCYVLGLPNGGHFCMFIVVLASIEELKQLR